MPAPESPYKNLFFQVYPGIKKTTARRDVTSAIRARWEVERPKGISGNLPTLRTMRGWRAEVDKQIDDAPPWNDDDWDGETAEHVPIGWLLGLNWIALAARGGELLQTEAEHAKRLHSSLDGLDLAGVWVLINEYAALDYLIHIYPESDSRILMTRSGLDAVVAFRPWTQEGQKSYLRMVGRLTLTQRQGVGWIPMNANLKTDGYGLPTFLVSRVNDDLTTHDYFNVRLTVHFSHLIGNPIESNQRTREMLLGESVEQFSNDVLKGMSWQEILAQENLR